MALRNRAVLYVIMTGLLLIVVTPFIWMVLGSVKTQG